MLESKVLIIGAGPSGITASIYLKRSNIQFILLEKYMVGGKLSLTSSIENYPGFKQEDGVQLALKMQDQLNYNNIEVTYDEIVSLKKEGNYFFLKGKEDNYKGEFVIVASGTKEKRLFLNNEDKYLGHGISFCAICDGALYKNKEVAIVGGGNSALEEALYLSSICQKVYIVHRRDKFKADAQLVSKVKQKENIKLFTPYVIINYIGDKHLSGIEIENVETKQKEKILVAGLFMYIGLEPNAKFIEEDIILEDGFIKTDMNMESSINNLFAVGDIKVKTLRQVVTATNDGAIAATIIKKRLEE